MRENGAHSDPIETHRCPSAYSPPPRIVSPPTSRCCCCCCCSIDVDLWRTICLMRHRLPAIDAKRRIRLDFDRDAADFAASSRLKMDARPVENEAGQEFGSLFLCCCEQSSISNTKHQLIPVSNFWGCEPIRPRRR